MGIRINGISTPKPAINIFQFIYNCLKFFKLVFYHLFKSRLKFIRNILGFYDSFGLSYFRPKSIKFDYYNSNLRASYLKIWIYIFTYEVLNELSISFLKGEI